MEHNDFKLAQQEFDREAHRLKRKWKREQELNLEKLNNEDPMAFWEAVKRIGRNEVRKHVLEANKSKIIKPLV